MIATELEHAAGAAFDRIAERYDGIFTSTPIGQSQRSAVWKRAVAAFPPGSRVLELNCGTGEDALFLAGKGVFVTACDASPQMIERARMRKHVEAPDASVDFRVLPNERLGELEVQAPFDGVFSNFSGLNCVEDLGAVFHHLASRLRLGAKLLLCVSTRCCVWEILHYSAQGNFRKATRRCRGVSEASFDGLSFPVYYPTIRSLRNSFEPGLRLRSITGIGITVPPSFLNDFIARHPGLLAVLERIDETLSNLPLFRVVGDHVLLQLEKV